MQGDKELSGKLRCETSENYSGKILKEGAITILSESEYYVEDFDLDGDAPKQLIRAYIFSRNSKVRKKNPRTWHKYIAKTAVKWYPHESVIEYMINRIGQEMGLRMNDIGLFRINGQIRFLSRYFLKSDEVLIHGAEICGDHLQDRKLAHEIANDKKTARELFTFEFVKESVEAVFPGFSDILLEDLVRIIVFDAVVGNNDRHFYNWGVIRSTEKSAESPLIAPIYDSSRGLFWNYSDGNIVKISKALRNSSSPQLDAYIKGASPRISIEGDQEIDHFKLISYLSSSNKRYHRIISELSGVDREYSVISMCRKEFGGWFTRERSHLIELVLKKRFQIVRDTLQ